MRKLAIAFGFMGMLALAAPAAAAVFVIGPGMLGNPGADDPSVGYSSLTLDEQFTYPDAPLASEASEPPLRPWEESWYQIDQMPGV